MRAGTLYYGDCLEWMQKWPGASADLIYLDPPFNSKSNYNILWGQGNGVSAQVRAFTDTWNWDHEAVQRVEAICNAVAHPAHKPVSALRLALDRSGMLAYLSYMAERLAVMHRILRPAGSIYVHCDATASHYLKLLMDGIFGAKQFRNEIIWKRVSAHSDSNRFGRNADRILFYSKGASWTWNQQYRPYDKSYRQRFRYQDPDGRLWSDYDLTAKGLSGGGYEYEYKGAESLWRVPPETMRKLDAEGRLHFTKTGGIRLKRYLDEQKGRPVQEIWDDISPINSQSKERLGYPTQKPLALMERIIRSSSNQGDTVLDPFCGCGTTIEAAQNLDRLWVGVDISAYAIDLIARKRLRFTKPRIEGIPMDMHAARILAEANRLDFEAWAVTRIPGLAPNQKQTGDRGIDGRGTLLAGRVRGRARQVTPKLVLGQVKSGKFSVSQLRDFCRVVDRERAAMGVFITLDAEPTASARTEMAQMGRIRIGSEDYPRVQMWSIRDYFEHRKADLPSLADPYTGKAMQPLLFR